MIIGILELFLGLEWPVESDQGDIFVGESHAFSNHRGFKFQSRNSRLSSSIDIGLGSEWESHLLSIAPKLDDVFSVMKTGAVPMAAMGVGSSGCSKAHKLDHGGCSTVWVSHREVLNVGVGGDFVLLCEFPESQELLGASARCVPMKNSNSCETNKAERY